MKPNNFIWLAVIGVVLVGVYFLFFDSSGGDFFADYGDSTMKTVTVELAEQNSLGQTGTATIVENEEGMLVVTLSMLGGNFSQPQPAHIHLGACPEPGPVEHPLSNVVNGISVTTLPVSWQDLVDSAEPMAINVHKSAAEASVYTACGDLPLDMSMDEMSN